jgi:multiple sugar transport system substrate-binding protein
VQIPGCSKANNAEQNSGINELSAQKNPEDYSGQFTMWEYSDELMQIVVKEFNKTYPNIKVNLLPVDGNIYDQKLQTALAAGTEIPDIIWLNYFQRGKLNAFDIFDELDKPPYNIDRSKFENWLTTLGENENKQLVSIEFDPAVMGLLYKRDISKKYIGTDDPAELGKLFSNYDNFLKACRDIKEKSQGKILPFASLGDVYVILDGMANNPYIKDKKLNATSVCDSVFPKLEVFVKEGLCGKIDQWSPSYYAALNSPDYCFSICPSWAVDYHIKPNAPDQKGNFGVCVPPGGKLLHFGGTGFAINKNSKNKEAAWQFFKWYLLSEEGARTIFSAERKLDRSGQIGPLKSLYADKTLYSSKDEFFGKQDVLKFFVDNINLVNVRPVTKYDTTIGNSLGLGLSVLKAGGDAAKCKEKILAELKIKLPEFN